MLEFFHDHFARFLQNARFADLLDVLIVSVFLYLFINWLRQSASRRLLISISIIVVFYFVSRFFELYLTELLIRGIMIVVLIASIIVFQSDIRRMVDLIGMWDIFRNSRRAQKASSRAVDVLTESVAKLAEMKTGALIAIKGREPWDRPIQGGIELGGRISQPLLYSIFSTKSPGHDGAVLLEDDRIVRFGSHLTLSTNFRELGNMGTRHAAGLGLSEQCDALVIIVSEERGTISLARDGKMEIIRSSGLLKERLDEFWMKHYSEQKTDITQSWRKTSIKTLLVSLLITALFWFLFAYQSDVVYRSYKVPIEWRNLQSNLEVLETEPQEARITLTGSEQAFRNFDPQALAVSLDLERLKKGINKFLIADDNLTLPRDLKLYNVEPQVVRIKAEEMTGVWVAVRVQTTGRLPGNKKLVSISANPRSILLRIPGGTGIRPDVVLTEPVNLSNITQTTTLKSRLLPPAESKLQPFQNPEVEIKITVKNN